jgi:hypothetical protein
MTTHISFVVLALPADNARHGKALFYFTTTAEEHTPRKLITAKENIMETCLKKYISNTTTTITIKVQELNNNKIHYTLCITQALHK